MCEQLSKECVLLILFRRLRDRLFWYWPAGVLMKQCAGVVIMNLAGDEKKQTVETVKLLKLPLSDKHK